MSDEDSNMAASPLPDMDSDSMLDGPVDEEERWLDALEKGELDDNGELKKEVDESLLTARQVSSRKICVFKKRKKSKVRPVRGGWKRVQQIKPVILITF